MSDKKNILSIIALVCAVLALGLAVFAVVTAAEEPTYYSDRLFELNRENEALQAQIDALNARLDSMALADGLSDWSLTAAAWADGQGADITLSATPAAWEDGMTAALSVRLEGREVANLPCAPEGEAFTATASLPAADGYSYYCVLVQADGSRQQFTLSSPENPTEDIPVYLQASLTAYCNLLVDSWEENSGTLVLTGAYVRVQPPLLSASGSVSIETAELVLSHNGAEAARTPIELLPGEGAGSFELELNGTGFPMPELAEDDYLELRLEVTLSDGSTLSAAGAGWYNSPDGLFLVVG